MGSLGWADRIRKTLVLGPFLFLGVLLSVLPRTIFIGVGLSVFYLTLLMPANPMVYDANLYLN